MTTYFYRWSFVEGMVSDNTPQRFEAYGWNVIGRRRMVTINSGIQSGGSKPAKAETSKSLLWFAWQTVIGFDAHANKSGSHRIVRRTIRWNAEHCGRACISWMGLCTPSKPRWCIFWLGCERRRGSWSEWTRNLQRISGFPRVAQEFERRVN